MAKTLHYADDARKGLFAGIEAVANAVKVTMGPKGRNVILERTYWGPIVTNDGVTVAKEIELEEKIENIGAYNSWIQVYLHSWSSKSWRECF